MRGFRVWHTKLNRYLKDDEFYVDSDGSVYSSFEVYNDEIIETDYIENFSRDDFDEGHIVREDDTGLKDKNGKEIYEGDICRCSFGECGVVNYRYGEFCIVGDDIVGMSLWKGKAFDIIGNVHENPELLKEEEK